MSDSSSDELSSYSSSHLSHSSSMDFLTYRQKHVEHRKMKAKQYETIHADHENPYDESYDKYSSSDMSSKSNENSSSDDEPSDPYFHEALHRQKALTDLFHRQILSFRSEVEALRHYHDARILHEGINAGLNSIEYNCHNRYVQEAIKYDYQLGYDRAFLIRTELMDKYRAELGESVVLQMIYNEMKKVIPQLEINRRIEGIAKAEEPNNPSMKAEEPNNPSMKADNVQTKDMINQTNDKANGNHNEVQAETNVVELNHNEVQANDFHESSNQAELNAKESNQINNKANKVHHNDKPSQTNESPR